MAEEFHTGVQYKLRAGSPMATKTGKFVLHTFWAERYRIDSYICTDKLPGSEKFRGQTLSSDSYVSASFSRLGIRGGTTFQGKVTWSPTFVEEDGLGFNL